VITEANSEVHILCRTAR